MKGYLVNNDEFMMGDPDFMPGFIDELDVIGCDASCGSDQECSRQKAAEQFCSS